MCHFALIPVPLTVPRKPEMIQLPRYSGAKRTILFLGFYIWSDLTLPRNPSADSQGHMPIDGSTKRTELYYYIGQSVLSAEIGIVGHDPEATEVRERCVKKHRVLMSRKNREGE